MKRHLDDETAADRRVRPCPIAPREPRKRDACAEAPALSAAAPHKRHCPFVAREAALTRREAAVAAREQQLAQQEAVLRQAAQQLEAWHAWLRRQECDGMPGLAQGLPYCA